MNLVLCPSNFIPGWQIIRFVRVQEKYRSSFMMDIVIGASNKARIFGIIVEVQDKMYSRRQCDIVVSDEGFVSTDIVHELRIYLGVEKICIGIDVLHCLDEFKRNDEERETKLTFCSLKK